MKNSEIWMHLYDYKHLITVNDCKKNILFLFNIVLTKNANVEESLHCVCFSFFLKKKKICKFSCLLF